MLDGFDSTGFARLKEAVKLDQADNALAGKPTGSSDVASLKLQFQSEEDEERKNLCIELLPVSSPLVDVASTAAVLFGFVRKVTLLHENLAIDDEASWRATIKIWNEGVTERRRHKVIELAAHAEAKFASANKREQLVGLEQIFELLAAREPARHHRGHADAVASTDPLKQPEEVVPPRRRRGKLCDVADDFLVRLVQRNIHRRLLNACAMHRDARESDNTAPLPPAKAAGGGRRRGGRQGKREPRAPPRRAGARARAGRRAAQEAARGRLDGGAEADDNIKFCTQSVARPLGPLGALAAAHIEPVLALVCEHTHALARVAANAGPETARLAAEVLAHALAHKWSARKNLAANRGLPRLAALLRSRSTHVLLCGAAAISLFVRDDAGRRLVRQNDAALLFDALATLATWPMDFMASERAELKQAELAAAGGERRRGKALVGEYYPYAARARRYRDGAARRALARDKACPSSRAATRGCAPCGSPSGTTRARRVRRRRGRGRARGHVGRGAPCAMLYEENQSCPEAAHARRGVGEPADARRRPRRAREPRGARRGEEAAREHDAPRRRGARPRIGSRALDRDLAATAMPCAARADVAVPRARSRGFVRLLASESSATLGYASMACWAPPRRGEPRGARRARRRRRRAHVLASSAQLHTKEPALGALWRGCDARTAVRARCTARSSCSSASSLPARAQLRPAKTLAVGCRSRSRTRWGPTRARSSRSSSSAEPADAVHDAESPPYLDARRAARLRARRRRRGQPRARRVRQAARQARARGRCGRLVAHREPSVRVVGVHRVAQSRRGALEARFAATARSATRRAARGRGEREPPAAAQGAARAAQHLDARAGAARDREARAAAHRARAQGGRAEGCAGRDAGVRARRRGRRVEAGARPRTTAPRPRPTAPPRPISPPRPMAAPPRHARHRRPRTTST